MRLTKKEVQDFQKQARSDFGISGFFIHDGEFYLADGGKEASDNFSLGGFDVNCWSSSEGHTHSIREADEFELQMWKKMTELLEQWEDHYCDNRDSWNPCDCDE